MAFMDQKKKAEIAQALVGLLPVDWKWSLKVRHHSTICLTITRLEYAFLQQLRKDTMNTIRATGFARIDTTHEVLGRDPELLLCKIVAVLNGGNHNRNQMEVDYHDVGWYVDFHIGRSDSGLPADQRVQFIGSAEAQQKRQLAAQKTRQSEERRRARSVAAAVKATQANQATRSVASAVCVDW